MTSRAAVTTLEKSPPVSRAFARAAYPMPLRPAPDTIICREASGEPYFAAIRPATNTARMDAPGTHARRPDAPRPDAPRSDAPRPDAVEPSFLQADRVALSLRGALERTTVPLARTAAALVASQAWCEFGFARLDDYARERFGRSGRWMRDLAALGDRLAALPRLAPALTGQDDARPLGRVAAMLVAKVATPATLDEWIARARALSIRVLRDEVRAARAALDAPPVAEAELAPDAGPASAVALAPRDPTAPDDDDDAADRLLVRMAVPSPVLAAFDEALDLFRAVEGSQATVASFAEALVAEAGDAGGDLDAIPAAAAASATLPDDARPHRTGPPNSATPRIADLRILRAGPTVAAVERALATSTRNWQHLPDHAESSWALGLAGVTLSRFRSLAAQAESRNAARRGDTADRSDAAERGEAADRGDTADRSDAADLDRRFRALIEIENELEVRLGVVLADLADRRAWSRLRFAGVGHYGEERLGLSRTTAEDRARLARDLRAHPRLREAYTAGHIGREAAALVARLLRDAPADPARAADREAAWVARATETTLKRMRDEARALGRYRVLDRYRALGAPRPDVPQSSARRSAHAPLDDDSWHASLRREGGLARRRIRQYGTLALFGRLTPTESDPPASPDVFQAVPHEPDAFLALRLPLDLGYRLIAAVESRRRRLTAEADTIPWDSADSGTPDPGLPDPGLPDAGVPDAPATAGDSAPSRLAARMFSIRCRRLPAWVGLLALLEEFVDTWDDERRMPRRPGDEIYVRDGWRCAAPGCTSRRNLEDHHVRYRSRGGDDDPANRICLCRFHHQRGEHGGLASCRGRAPTGLLWRLGRRGPGEVWYRNERQVGNPARV